MVKKKKKKYCKTLEFSHIPITISLLLTKFMQDTKIKKKNKSSKKEKQGYQIGDSSGEGIFYFL